MNIRSQSLFVVLIASASLALAQSSGGDFVLTKSTLDSGGGVTVGSVFELTGTIAQPDAPKQQSVGGKFIVSGGFWPNARDPIFSDGYEGD